MAFNPIIKDLVIIKRYKRNHTFYGAASDMVAPLAMHEMPKAMMHLPIGFAKLDGNLGPVAIQGLSSTSNLLVAPDGHWRGRYLPMCYRFQPFALATLADDRQVLCFDADSDLMSVTDGEPFFTEDGQRTEAVNQILRALGIHAARRKVTREVCALLNDMGLMVPWPIEVEDDQKQSRSVLGGLFKIDESVFHQITGDQLVQIRDRHALVVIYSQLLSMRHLGSLKQIAGAVADHGSPGPTADGAGQGAALGASLPTDEMTLSFDHFGG